jgi:glycosyltransferase involved in cell wall biosynthesis
MKRSAILIIDPRGNISLGGKDVINRHINYAKILYSKSKEQKLIICTTSYQGNRAFRSKFMDRYVLSKPTLNPVVFSWRVYRCIRREKIKVQLIVVGDPWESFWAGFLLTKLIRRKIPIQLQIHGDIADPLWTKINWRNKVRFHLAKYSCSKSKSIRAVGHNQKNNLIRYLNLSASKIEVIPVPISNNVISSNKIRITKRPKSIALIGRIHEDRGIWSFLDLVTKLNHASKDFDVIIIGSGKAESEFISRVKLEIPRQRLQILGQLSELSLAMMWNKIGVLASLAPVESYGRVMREGLISGVPVWVSKSSGALDLINMSRSKGVKLLDLNSSDKILLNEFESLIRVKPDYNFRNKLLIENKTLASLLVNSWLKLVND